MRTGLRARVQGGYDRSTWKQDVVVYRDLDVDWRERGTKADPAEVPLRAYEIKTMWLGR